VSKKPRDGLYKRYGKRLLDLTLIVLAFFPLSLAMLLLAALGRFRLGSPVLFRQQRPGLHGRPFTIYKFRTMTSVRDDQGNLLSNAERLASYDRFLRRTRRANAGLLDAPKYDRIEPLQPWRGVR